MTGHNETVGVASACLSQGSSDRGHNETVGLSSDQTVSPRTVVTWHNETVGLASACLSS